MNHGNIKSETYSRLPKVAQEYIQDLERRLESATKALHDFMDHQTHSEFYVDHMTNEGQGADNKRIYIQGQHFGCDTGDLEISFNLTYKKNLRIFFNGFNQKDAVIVPNATNSIEIKAVRRD
jgi:hypothetical protein